MSRRASLAHTIHFLEPSHVDNNITTLKISGIQDVGNGGLSFVPWIIQSQSDIKTMIKY